MKTARRFLLDNLKNVRGWRTRRRLVVFNVDDYGNVRLASRQARDELGMAGLVVDTPTSRFDRLDAIETREDLEALFEVLDSVVDAHGRPAVFTAYALSANPDFARIVREMTGYHYESLPVTFARLADEQPDAYRGAWDLWREGMSRGFIRPQFHGREHLNLGIFERKLHRHDPVLLANLKAGCMAGLGGEQNMPGVGFTHAYGLWDRSEIERHREIIADGLKLFEQVFGFRSQTFTPPAQKLHPDLYPWVESQGVRAIDKPLYCVRRLDRERTMREFNTLGRRRGQGHLSIVRNVVFEPTNVPAFDAVSLALNQVAAAFRWRKPAIISSHRVNFSGHIDPKNRRLGLAALKRLLTGIVQRWPDVEFVGADELASIMAQTYP